MSDLDALLASVTCTKPWTLDDSRALYAMLKPTTSPDEHVDINCPRGDQVFVTISSPRGTIRKVYDVV
jgi:hypothetical protein